MLSFFSCPRTRFRSLETFSPCRKSWICSVLTAGCSCFVGANCFDFSPRELPLHCRRPSPNCSSGFCC
ncbi:hypothetical protein SLEP1_g15091 [Rubroshorea leprosula]|uniref:Secreted protein n=1 Tax=Rubroshorea leprosula TaxID=152421 RepID=A0AAV5IXY7_9ROSI|nr:hypothetical protein SLEP1_g15091 [Rubroshorea leprosula]